MSIGYGRVRQILHLAQRSQHAARVGAHEAVIVEPAHQLQVLSCGSLSV